MISWLYSLPLLALAAVILSCCIGFGVMAVFAARRLGWIISPDDTGTAGIMHGFVSLVYAVVLGLMVAGVQEGFEQVEDAATAEASAIGNFYRTFGGMTPETRDRFRRLTHEYIDLVIGTEWPAQARGEESEETWLAADDLMLQLLEYHPQNEHEGVLYGELIGDMHEVLDARRLRLHLGQTGIGPIVWLVIIAGAVITIGFIAAFPMAQVSRQVVMTSVMATMFGLMIFLIFAMDYPLRGRLAVDPSAFARVRDNMVRVEQTAARREALDVVGRPVGAP